MHNIYGNIMPLAETKNTCALWPILYSKRSVFSGKIIAATNRDLAVAMQEGRFREDLYFRLCSDVIQTPSLREQLAESPDDLQILLGFIAPHVLNDDPEEADRLAVEVDTWIKNHLGLEYPWPGNIRELEQCVRNVMIRREYRPTRHAEGGAETDPCDTFLAAIKRGDVRADELISKYYAIVYVESGSYQEAGRRLGVDWRTVKSKVSEDFLRELSESNE